MSSRPRHLPHARSIFLSADSAYFAFWFLVVPLHCRAWDLPPRHLRDRLGRCTAIRAHEQRGRGERLDGDLDFQKISPTGEEVSLSTTRPDGTYSHGARTWITKKDADVFQQERLVYRARMQQRNRFWDDSVQSKALNSAAARNLG
ncbi:hypothetical protein BJ170DRAFT_606104 [Xylariales sp. AK1849]|nr:hypothetical protein BJ170DRAFT_606104 [Xylariales sp. AK1849]